MSSSAYIIGNRRKLQTHSGLKVYISFVRISIKKSLDTEKAFSVEAFFDRIVAD